MLAGGEQVKRKPPRRRQDRGRDHQLARRAAAEGTLLDYIREADTDLAQEIMDNMFTFDDLIKLDDKAIQCCCARCRARRWSSR